LDRIKLGVSLERDAQNGFTMVEMIIVVVLASAIMGVAFYRMQGLSDQSRSDTVKGDLRAIQTAVNAYYLNHKDGDGQHIFPAGNDWQTNDLVNDTPRVLRQPLYDPFQPSNTQYGYYTSSDGKYFVAFSFAPDRSADINGINTSGNLTGTEDDDIFVTNGTGNFA
jgi:general secretion pathway protein G